MPSLRSNNVKVNRSFSKLEIRLGPPNSNFSSLHETNSREFNCHEMAEEVVSVSLGELADKNVNLCKLVTVFFFSEEMAKTFAKFVELKCWEKSAICK